MRRAMSLVRRLLVVALILVAAGAAYLYWERAHTDGGEGGAGAPGRARQAGGGRGRSGAGGEPVPVLAATAERGDVPIYLDALGTVQAFETVTVHSMIDGPLQEVRFREGQDVRRGDVLARIDPRPTQAALDQAVAKKAQDEANLANARLDAQRYAKLAQNAYTSTQQADTARAQVAQLEAQVRQDQAQIDSARTQLSYSTITAPIDGRTGIRQVDPGNIVHPSDTNGIVVITTLRPISVVFTLPQQALPAVSRAIEASRAAGDDAAGGLGNGSGPEVLALPQAGAQAATPPGARSGIRAGAAAGAGQRAADAVLDRGRLAVLDNQVDQTTGTIRLKATFPNPELKLWPGGFVNVRLLVETRRDVVTVPPVAVQRGPAGAYVYVVADGKATRRPVATSHEDERIAIVDDGLRPGEAVVVDGASRLTEGTRVNVVSPAADPGAAPGATTPSARNGPGAPGTRRRRTAEGT